jgi:hypothetical protein
MLFIACLLNVIALGCLGIWNINYGSPLTRQLCREYGCTSLFKGLDMALASASFLCIIQVCTAAFFTVCYKMEKKDEETFNIYSEA